MKLNRDHLNHVPVGVAANDAMALIDRVQDWPPERQMLAITSTFKLLAERFGVTGGDIFTVADNVMNHADGRRSEFLAIQDYLEGEL